MPFHEGSRMDARLEFVMLASVEGANVRNLCRRFGVSPTSGYKWLERWRLDGMAGLQELSRRPQNSPSRSAAAMEQAVLSVRTEHPAWGGRKIARRLKDLGQEAVPAPSTVTAILKRHGVELGAHGGGQSAFIRFERARPNELALLRGACGLRQPADRDGPAAAHHRHPPLRPARAADHRQWFALGDGPGSPFTPLGVWLIEHGIRISHSRPYHPQTMGKDERFHRSLKAEVLSGPPLADLAAAERAFDRWRNVYNTQRPHEALELAVPASRYQPSPRDYVETIAPFEYAPGDIVRRVQQGGHVSFLGRTVKVPKAFRGKAIAFRSTTHDGVFDVVFLTQKVAIIDIRGLDRRPESVHDVSEHPSTLSPV